MVQCLWILATTAGYLLCVARLVRKSTLTQMHVVSSLILLPKSAALLVQVLTVTLYVFDHQVLPCQLVVVREMVDYPAD